MKLSFLLFFLCFLNGFAQTNYYVDQQNGNNTNDGLSPVTAFKTINSTLTGLLTGGDTLFIMGEYTNASYDESYVYNMPNDAHLWHSENTIRINNLHGTPPQNGQAAKYITIKGYDSNTILKGDGSNIFRILNSSYVIIEELTIEGNINIPLATANAIQFVYIDTNTVANENAPLITDIKYRDQDCVSNCTPNAVVDGEIYSDLSGMNIKRPSYVDTRGLYASKVENIIIRNNTIRYMPGGGLRVSDCEDIDIIENEISYCSRRSYSGTHGLVITKATSTRTGDDYRIRILRNKVHHNFNEQYSWAPTKTVITPHIDEGKGISLQRNQTTYNTDGSIDVNWENGRILVQNNICYYNGFSGVHSNDGNRIDIINNTCYFNSYTKSITEGITSSSNGGNIGISANGGVDIKILNNISIIDSNLSKSAIASPIAAADGLVVRDNIIYGTEGAISENANVASLQVNTQMVDPLFVDAANFDFNLQATSPAIDPTTALQDAPTVDFFNNTRDSNPDIGAIEYASTLSIKDESFTSIKIYPNPATHQITIEGIELDTSKVRLYNSLGQELHNFKFTSSRIMNISTLPTGIYFLKLSGTVRKILKK
ncbi:putative secreted protein (Por secretion system target) [Kordia periserrulae]|uniref:Putative secreted protein (Por secretion system target) n=1 Tax=Kordia periserrulae TaxID=701523 RepID=A0A2T6C1Z5_9FLAO|nr:T9SS type A sorting domain-containing protein [Kordia periserrulae]PTX62344.1 putative secreted protein (Por secretion system target) [Kordia periserrulae]